MLKVRLVVSRPEAAISFHRLSCMSRLRVYLAWLLFAAIPLQGLAAASMLYCGESHGSHLGVVVHSGALQNGHDHSAHVHDAVMASSTPSHDVSAAVQLSDADHECSVCASCYQAVGLPHPARSALASPAVPGKLAQTPVLIESVPAALPEKPPRT